MNLARSAWLAIMLVGFLAGSSFGMWFAPPDNASAGSKDQSHSDQAANDKSHDDKSHDDKTDNGKAVFSIHDAASKEHGHAEPAVDGSHTHAANHSADGHGHDPHAAGDAGHAGHDADGHGGHVSIGDKLPLYTVIPFAALLLSIAVMPLVAHHWWEHNSSKGVVALTAAVPMVIYWLAVWKSTGVHMLEEAAIEYVNFIALLGALFVVSGGIFIQGSFSGTPIVNTAMIAFGALIASFVGTTGASMLLIRPLLRANAPRQNKAHIVVFFIFIVSNCGGLLTPLGDPPLFLGFMKGVPFDWTLRLWKEWLTVNILLLVIFNIFDQVIMNREEIARAGSQLEAVQRHEPLRVKGLFNLLLLAGVLAAVYAGGKGIGFASGQWPFGIQAGILGAIAIVSYLTTTKSVHEANRFSFAPINEVAILFAAIFVTMTPALQILNFKGPSLGVSEPWQFFWVTGGLSSFLDNAPTYLTFAATACGIEGIPAEGAYLAEFLKLPKANAILAAISCGAVFMGANTYIGNGPNFMVKAIAEENGVKMPGFFGYMVYSGAILLPVFVVTTLLFFR